MLRLLLRLQKRVMKIEKIPMRMCVVTREKMPKKDLIRVVYFNDTLLLIRVENLMVRVVI